MFGLKWKLIKLIAIYQVFKLFLLPGWNIMVNEHNASILEKRASAIMEYQTAQQTYAAAIEANPEAARQLGLLEKETENTDSMQETVPPQEASMETESADEEKNGTYENILSDIKKITWLG